MERHLSGSEWIRVLSAPAGDSGVDAAAAHLASCGPCWDGAAGAIAELRRCGVSLYFQDARSSIVAMVESKEKAALRWLLAQAAWGRLKRLDVEEQVKRLRADPALQTREMLDAVLADASGIATDDPFLAEECAQVAHALASFLPESVCPTLLREDLQGAAMLAVANSRRLAADWTGTVSAIEAAHRHFALGTGDPAKDARLLSIQASLSADTGRLENALNLLSRASEIARRSPEAAGLASLSVQEANTFLAASLHEEAITRAEKALGFLAPGEDRLEMLARSIITESLVFLERPVEALRCFASALPLYEQVAGRRTELLQGYLEALLLDAFGFSREAEKAFRVNIAGFMAVEQYKDAFLSMLTYFEMLVRKGSLGKAERICDEALDLTKQAGSGCHGQMIGFWQDLSSLLQAGRLRKHHLAEARDYLVRSWHLPAAQGSQQQLARTVGLRIPAGIQESEQACTAQEGEWIAPEAIPQPETSLTAVIGFQEEMERLDRELVAQGFAQCGGRLRQASLLLGVARDTLRAKVKKYGLTEQASSADATPSSRNQQGGSALRDEQFLAVLTGVRARACWRELATLPVEQQIRQLESVSSLRTPEMLDTVLSAAKSAAGEDPALGEQRAQVAQVLAGLLPASCYSRRRQADLQGEAMLIIANCRRRAGDFPGAAAALDATRRYFGRGTGDTSQTARLLSIQASLAANTGHAEDATNLLALADVACRRAKVPAVASIAVQEASTLLGDFRYGEAFIRAQAALRMLAPGERRLELLARSIITESLALLGRPGEALLSLFASLPLYERLRGHRNELLLGYLVALVLDCLGYAREAADAFHANITGWMEAEQYKDALLTLLTQFERLYRRGEIDEAARVCRDALRRFEEAEPERHGPILDLWRDLLALAENREITDRRILEARDFAMAAFARRPARAPEPPPVRVGRLLRVEPAAPVGRLAPGDYKIALERRERQLIAAALDQCQGRLGEACRQLGISDPTLRAKIKKYRLKGWRRRKAR